MPTAIFDMDGVLYRGSQVLPYAREALDRLRAAGWQTYLATNNSTITRAEYVERLGAMGLGGDLVHVVTSASVTAGYLDRLRPRPRDVLVLGGEGLREEIRAVGIAVRAPAEIPGTTPTGRAAVDGLDPAAMREHLVSLDLPTPADALVVGLDLHLTYAKLAEAQRTVLAGAPFVASNRDRAYPVEGRLLPGAGAIVAAIEVATGVRAVCVGKPEPGLFREILRSGGEAGDGVVVIGDSLEYDIVAAHRVGAVGVLVTTGLSRRADAEAAEGEAIPDRVVEGLEGLFALPEFAGA